MVFIHQTKRFDVHVYMWLVDCELPVYIHIISGKGVWYIPDLQDGLDLVKTLDPYNENAVKITPCESHCHQYAWPGWSVPILQLGVVVSEVPFLWIKYAHSYCKLSQKSVFKNNSMHRGRLFVCIKSAGFPVETNLDIWCVPSVAAGNPPKVPEGAQRVFMDTVLFWNYPHFLPATGFSRFPWCSVL